MPNIENNTMSTFTLGGKTFEIKDASARSNIQTINTVLDTKADTSDMSNYYTKSETYNKTEVNNLIESSGGSTGDGDVKKNLLFDSILDDETKTTVNITINTAGEATTNEVQNIPYTILYGNGSAENPGVGKVGITENTYLRYGGNGKSLCFPVIGGHTYAFIPEVYKTEFNYGDRYAYSMCFAPDFDFDFKQVYTEIPNTFGSVALDVSIHTTEGTGKIFHSTIKDKIIVPEGMQYLIWSVTDKLVADGEQPDGIRKFKMYDYTTYPTDATYEQIVDNPVTGENFTITYNLTNSISTNTTLIVSTGSTYTTTINANQNNYISSCSVIIGGTTYTPINGNLIIDNANSNIVINAVGESVPNNTYENFYTIKESLIPDSLLNSKIDTPNGLLNAIEGKILYTDGQGGLTLSLPKESVDIIAHNLEYIPVYGEWIAGYYYNMNSECVEASDEDTMWTSVFKNTAICTPYDNMIRCNENEKWRFNVARLRIDSIGQYFPSIHIFNKNKNIISTVTNPQFDSEGWYYMTMPEGAYYLAINGQSPLSGTNFMQRLGIPIYNKTNVLNHVNASYNIIKRTKIPTLKPLDKGYICIGTDDLRVNETGALHTLFTTQNIPYYIAAIPESMKCNIPYEGGRTTNLAICRMCVKNGGELLVHNGEPITADNVDSYDKLFDYFVRTKEELKAYGFNIRGLILAGGTGAIQTDPRIDRWASAYYDFTDRFGVGYPYGGTSRTGLQYVETSAIDELVNDVCVNHNYRFIMTHTAEEKAVENFNHLIQQLSNYTRGVDYEFITPSQLYDLLMPEKQDDYYSKSEVDSLINSLSLRVENLELEVFPAH